MTIQVPICRPDGTQALETRQVPDDYAETLTVSPEAMNDL